MPKHTLRKSKPTPLNRVAVTGDFWRERLDVNRDVTLPIEYKQCKKTGRIDAFKLDWKKGDPNRPHFFWDSDVAKWIEAVGYSLATDPDPKLERMTDRVIDLIEAAQQDDGYLNIHFTVVRPEMRWKNLRQWHELYCAGHLMEAAVAYYEGTGKRQLLDVMCRYADHIDAMFGAGKGKARGYPGHEEIELALVKLYRATGEERYLALSKFFVDERGTQPHYYDAESKRLGKDAVGRHWNNAPTKGWFHDYNQAHLPVREQTTAEGHAVRACYLYAGMADVAIETGDRKLLAACKRIWRNIVERRMYIHGGVGSSRFGERFSYDYDLPNEEAYAETCASIALVFFATRLLQADPDGAVADVMERALYNSVISGVSLDGERFFYDNLLAVEPDYHRFSGQKSPNRQEWFGCACCPPNLARILSSFGEYIYGESKNEVWVHLYASSRAMLQVAGQSVVVEQKTAYPWKDKVRLSVRPERPATFTLSLRIPGWCRKPSLKVNGKTVALGPITKKGYARVKREWGSGDRITLTLPMPVERMAANPRVRHDAGRVALQRGPVLYCLEQVDNGADLNAISLPVDAKLRVTTDKKLFGGAPVITGKVKRDDPKAFGKELYVAATQKQKPAAIKAVPYFMWNNRNPGEMLVWIREG